MALSSGNMVIKPYFVVAHDGHVFACKYSNGLHEGRVQPLVTITNEYGCQTTLGTASAFNILGTPIVRLYRNGRRVQTKLHALCNVPRLS